MPLTLNAELAWLPEAGVAANVLIEIDEGRFTAVTPETTAPPGVVRRGVRRLAGLTLPGLANAHSHAFHRALRGRVHGAGGFWDWRRQMYALADRLDPDTCLALARAVYGEMALAGVTCVGEFHYLHHAPGGARYADPNAMGHALMLAAAEAGVRITLLDTLYLTADVDGAPLAGPQLRFGDDDVDGWSSRVAALRTEPHALVGAAIHSVRAAPAPALADMAARAAGRPLHLHLSEQPAENDACQAVHGCSPTELLHATGVLGPDTTAAHATHLSDVDILLLGDAEARACLCPTTERDLADGIGPARRLSEAGVRLCLGSDSHAVVDLLEEARAVELDERLRSGHRGSFDAAQLLRAATSGGHAALGWPDAGRIEAGCRADLVTVRLDSVRTAGADRWNAAEATMFAATAADVAHVFVDGREIVRDGRHTRLDVPADLRQAIAAVYA